MVLGGPRGGQYFPECLADVPLSLSGPFRSSTGNVSARHETDITPAGWTFSIWGVIYTWLSLMVIYITSYVFRGYGLAATPPP